MTPAAARAAPAVTGVDLRVLDDLSQAEQLFAFAAAATPPRSSGSSGWAAWRDARLVGALLLERHGATAMLYGPVVLAAAAREPTRPDAQTARPAADALEIAAHLVEIALGDAAARGLDTVFARPQGLERIWVRYGFIPVPEGALPAPLRGRPGAGLFAYRGGSALWTLRTSPDGTAEEPWAAARGGRRNRAARG